MQVGDAKSNWLSAMLESGQSLQMNGNSPALRIEAAFSRLGQHLIVYGCVSGPWMLTQSSVGPLDMCILPRHALPPPGAAGFCFLLLSLGLRSPRCQES